MHTLINNSSLKRKRGYLSSPPPEIPDLDQDGAGAEALEQAIQKDSDTHSCWQAYTEWSGRGRSPFKTPATAAIDGLKEKARLLEAFEREISRHQDQLERLLTVKKARLHKIYQSKSDIAQGERSPRTIMGPNTTQTPFSDTPVFPLPTASTARSLSPSKYLARLAEGTPSIIHRTFESGQARIPRSVQEVRKLLQEDLDIGCMPQRFKVSSCFSIHRES